MKIKELIKQLQKIKNQNALVVLASDSEGNSFDVLDEAAEAEGYDEESRGFLDVSDGGKKVVVLYPA